MTETLSFFGSGAHSVLDDIPQDVIENLVETLDNATAVDNILSSKHVPQSIKVCFSKMKNQNSKNVVFELLKRTLNLIERVLYLRVTAAFMVAMTKTQDIEPVRWCLDFLSTYSFDEHFSEFMYIACNGTPEKTSPAFRIAISIMCNFIQQYTEKVLHISYTDMVGILEIYSTKLYDEIAFKLDSVEIKPCLKKKNHNSYDHLKDYKNMHKKAYTIDADGVISVSSRSSLYSSMSSLDENVSDNSLDSSSLSNRTSMTTVTTTTSLTKNDDDDDENCTHLAEYYGDDDKQQGEIDKEEFIHVKFVESNTSVEQNEKTTDDTAVIAVDGQQNVENDVNAYEHVQRNNDGISRKEENENDGGDVNLGTSDFLQRNRDINLYDGIGKPCELYTETAANCPDTQSSSSDSINTDTHRSSSDSKPDYQHSHINRSK